jgi:hydroxypyruvate reductase
VISLISGGGSALLVLPPPSISLAEKGDTTGLLLKSGAAIHEVNAVRKHLSLVKGGNLAAAAYPATVLNLMISDVVGDPMDVIASGPFVPDPSSFATALGILDRYTLRDRVPPSVREYIEAGIEGKAAETPKEGNEVFERVTNVIVASNIIALQSAQQEALRLGYNTVVLSSGFEGETRDVAFFHAAVAREARHSGNPVSPPACIISGGETTVTVRGGGLGGRNMEFALQSALFLDGIDGIDVASVGTDGTDGPTDAAGAFADGGTVRRARAKGLDIRVYGENSDSYNFFKALGDLIVTGPTNTNVMDMHIFVVR